MNIYTIFITNEYIGLAISTYIYIYIYMRELKKNMSIYFIHIALLVINESHMYLLAHIRILINESHIYIYILTYT